MAKPQPPATLTDVKNKTGDVFAAADKNKFVVITSYNKPKYVISTYTEWERLHSAEATSSKENAVTEQPKDIAKESETVTASINIEPPAVIGLIASSTEPVAELPVVPDVEAPQISRDVELAADAKVEEPVSNETESTEVFAWPRNSALEHAWYKKTRNLLS